MEPSPGIPNRVAALAGWEQRVLRQQHLTAAGWQDAHIKTAKLMAGVHLLQGRLAAITAAGPTAVPGSESAGSGR